MSTQHHTSSANCSLDITKFDVIVFPGKFEIEIGNTAIFTCEISPQIPWWLERTVTYRWSRGDNVPIGSRASGINTDTLTIVSIFRFKFLMFLMNNYRIYNDKMVKQVYFFYKNRPTLRKRTSDHTNVKHQRIIFRRLISVLL